MLIGTIQNSLGHISLTTDMKSNPNLDGFKAVTAHFMERNTDGEIVEAACMIAFRFVEGDHTGEHLGHIFFRNSEREWHIVQGKPHCCLEKLHVDLFLDRANHDGQCIKL
jgi:hypothetical protein